MGHVRPCDGPRWHSSAIHACRDNSATSNHEARSAQARGQHYFALFGAAALARCGRLGAPVNKKHGPASRKRGSGRKARREFFSSVRNNRPSLGLWGESDVHPRHCHTSLRTLPVLYVTPPLPPLGPSLSSLVPTWCMLLLHSDVFLSHCVSPVQHALFMGAFIPLSSVTRRAVLFGWGFIYAYDYGD